MKNIIIEESFRDHSQADAFVLFIMTHGKNGFVYGTDEERVSVDEDIADVLGQCVTLRHKPKILFFQACRGMRIFQFSFDLHLLLLIQYCHCILL